MDRNFDAIVVGQGLAGTTLAWKLLDAGLSVLVLDREEPTTSSRIAAGLITPITGKRFVTTENWNQQFSVAESFYRNIEKRTNSHIFHPCPMLRIFTSQEERERFLERRTHHSPLVTSMAPAMPVETESCQFGGFEMQGARLNVRAYLDQSREIFKTKNAYLSINLNVDEDICVEEGSVSLPNLHVTADHLIFCQGFQQVRPRMFQPVRFNPAKGEVIDFKFDQFQIDRVIHHGFWIAPLGESLNRMGATYEWNDLSNNTTEAGKQWLTERLERLFPDRSYKIEKQLAAVRPTMQDFQPVLGFHPEQKHIGILNGLGSKGSLLAPYLSDLLTECMLHSSFVPDSLKVDRWFN